jgi:hypothetical protein
MAALGTERTYQLRRRMSEIGSRPENICSQCAFLSLTDTVEKVLVIFGEQ